MTPAPGETDRRPRWRKKRWRAAAALWLVAAYPLSFVPACWVLMRIRPASHPTGWQAIRRFHAPTGVALASSPRAVQAVALRLVALGKPDDAAVIAAGGIGMLTRDPGPDGEPVVIVYRVW